MKRDFTETAEQSLKGLIDQINDEQWWNWTDAIGDFFTFGLDIQHYLDNVDQYHKKILDKNNTTKGEIEKIFQDVRAVDAAYQSIFQKYCDGVREQREYIEQLAACIDTGESNFTVDRISSLMSPAAVELSEAKVTFYLGKIRKGEDNGPYDFEYIKKIMNTAPDEIPPELYEALIRAFNKMTLSDKEKFIECVYVRTEEYYVVKGGGAGTFKYEVSDVLRAMAVRYGRTLDGIPYNLEDPEVQEKIGNYTLLRAVCEQGSAIYVAGSRFFGTETYTDLDFKLEKIKNNSEKNSEDIHDYCLTFNGSSTPYDEWGRMNCKDHIINTYSIRESGNIDRIFDDHAIELAESLRVDIKQKQFETIISGAADIVMSFVEIPVAASVSKTVNDTVIECFSVGVEGNITNTTIDKLQTLLIDGNTYVALGLNASFSISDGSYQIHYGMINKQELNDRLEAYQYYTQNKLNFGAEDVILSIKGEKNRELTGLDDFVDWFTHNNGEDKTRLHTNGGEE